MTKSAHLRVYSPEAASSDEPVPGFVRSYGILSEEESQPSSTAEWRGQRVVCPTHLRLRVLESTVAFASAFRGLGAGLVPEPAARAADHELKVYRRLHPEHRSHILTSAWHVPVRWFVAFEPAEKEVYERPDGPSIRYRTSVEEARARIRRAHEVLLGLGVFAAPAEELEHVADWLEPFPPGSMVELDYSDVADLFDPQDLVFDDSCDLVMQSLDALEEGDMMRAGELYGRVVTRWAPAFAVTFSN